MLYVGWGTDEKMVVSRTDDLQRIRRTLLSIAAMLRDRGETKPTISQHANGDPVTDVDYCINRILLESLPKAGEGWLSEETEDGTDRLGCDRVWIVDPIDGTREFIAGIPEWAVSIALIEGSEAVAGGILNPGTGELFLGAQGLGLTCENVPETVSPSAEQKRPLGVLVSRREDREGKWDQQRARGVACTAVGSIAYRLARVAAGYGEATCTFEARHEWDIAGGVALILAAGGEVHALDGKSHLFNQRDTLLQGCFAYGPHCSRDLRGSLAPSDVTL